MQILETPLTMHMRASFLLLPVQSVDRAMKFYRDSKLMESAMPSRHDALRLKGGSVVQFAEPGDWAEFSDRPTDRHAAARAFYLTISVETKAHACDILGAALAAGASIDLAIIRHDVRYLGQSLEDLDGHRLQLVWAE